MADLTYIQSTQEVKVAGQDSTGNNSNYVGAGTDGGMFVAGSTASGSTDAGNPVKAGARYNVSSPIFSDGNRTDLQSDINGRIITVAVPVDGVKATYRASNATAFAPGAAATDIATLTGSATKTIRITRISVTGTQTTASEVNLFLLKRSTANTGGTSTSLVAVPNDSNSAAATATALAYTANPTTGTLVGTIFATKAAIPVPAIGGNTTQGSFSELRFGDTPSQAIVLRGTSQVFAVNLGGTSITGGSFLISFEWTEE